MITTSHKITPISTRLTALSYAKPCGGTILCSTIWNGSNNCCYNSVIIANRSPFTEHILLVSLITLLVFGTGCGQAPTPDSVADDGIQVHEHWTVTVTNPDGIVDTMHEFDNELTNPGKQMLPALLFGELSVANHSIAFGEQSNQNNWRCLEESPNQNQDNPDLSFYFRLVPATASRPMTAPDISTKVLITAGCTIAAPRRGNMTIDSVMVLIGTNESFNATKSQSAIQTY